MRSGYAARSNSRGVASAPAPFGSRVCSYSGSPSNVVVGTSSVVAMPGYRLRALGSRLTSMTVRLIDVVTSVAAQLTREIVEPVDPPIGIEAREPHRFHLPVPMCASCVPA